MELRNTTEIVKQVLEVAPVTRNSDGLLYIRVLEILAERSGIDYMKMPARTLFANLKELGVPSVETVGRCRRKVQAENEHLRANKKVEQFRSELEAEFREYARN